MLDNGMSVLFNFNPTLTISAGEINGAATSFLGGGTVGERTVTWSVGAINTDSTYSGTIRDGGTSGHVPRRSPRSAPENGRSLAQTPTQD